MRYIHPVGIHEKFVASGQYQHPHITTWSIHEMPDGAWMIRLDHDRRTADGTSLLIEAWRSPIAEGGKIGRFDIWGYGGAHHTIKNVRARYFVIDNMLEASIQFDKNPQTVQSIPYPANALLMPNLPLFWGYAIHHLSNSGKGIIFSCTPDFDVPETFFPTAHERAVLSLGDDEILVSNKHITAKKFLMDDTHLVWTDGLGVVLAYINTDNTTEVVKNYARRPKR